ncbi:diaminopimelate epimerase [Geoglobus acetivorans]|uniref:Diaminopimelate epimerase n=1 Tax=Geoglobus acetivorans TaxID=565033 RepID=A0A0A7GEQ4_GEOAI|nr:Diaminopimelate epimerase [Geoglobus acetivorans]
MKVKFTKMHGNGNDFILIDEFSGIVIEEERKSEFVKAVCNRYFGVGADGALFVQKSEVADARFRYFNADGSEAEMCGNGIRCFSRYVVEEGYAESPLNVETLAGTLELEVFQDEEGWWVSVDMGEPKFGRDGIPAEENVWGKVFEVGDRKFEVYAVNTGVPHAVIFVEDLDFDIIPYAREIRYNELFPEGINVNFAEVLDGRRIRIRTYERGVEDETLSCGTGSCAVAVVAHRLGISEKSVEIITRGGKLKIDVGDRVFMTGGASRVADGHINTGELRYDLP